MVDCLDPHFDACSCRWAFPLPWGREAEQAHAYAALPTFLYHAGETSPRATLLPPQHTLYHIFNSTSASLALLHLFSRFGSNSIFLQFQHLSFNDRLTARQGLHFYNFQPRDFRLRLRQAQQHAEFCQQALNGERSFQAETQANASP